MEEDKKFKKREAYRKYREEHREELYERHRIYYEANKERLMEYARKYKAEHRAMKEPKKQRKSAEQIATIFRNPIAAAHYLWIVNNNKNKLKTKRK